MPRFSIVIPTRQRADTLRFAIETALAQTHPDFEVVVQNNGNDPATNDVVAAFASPRIVLHGSDDILPISENFEAALNASGGEYVAFIGDDDGMMPNACAVCDALMSDRPMLGALHWTPHNYDWPNSLRETARNRLVVNFPGSAAGTICISRDLLLQLYDGTLIWTNTPLIYNACFVRRSVIEKVKAFCGGVYFAGPVQDVHSGIADLWAMEQYLHIDRPLSMCGASGHSNGNALFVGSSGERLQRRYHAENPVLRQQIAEYFLDTANLELTVASALITAKRMFFQGDPGVVLNMRNILLRMALGANRDSTLYDHTLDEMRQVATRYGIDTSGFDIPPKRHGPEVPFQGPVTDASGRTTMLVVDGAAAGLATVADAVRLTAAMLALQTPAQLNALMPRPETGSAVVARVATELAELAPLLAVRPRDAAVARYFRLTDAAVQSQRGDVGAQSRLLPGLTTELSVCQIPPTPRGRPLAWFVPDILCRLPHAALRALPFLARFDLAICEWPGHGAAGETADASLSAIAAEFAVLIDRVVPAGQGVFVIGESVGGLVALSLARLRPQQVRNVILLDTPFCLTRPSLAADLTRTWQQTAGSPYLRRLLRDVLGFDPIEPQTRRESMHYALLQDAAFNCALIPGGEGTQHAMSSVLLDEDLAALRAINPSLLMTPRVEQAGHHLLQDDPQATLAELNKLLVHG
jgi:glycosyltransferase involved in cell wall biosynthesis/pimeloyl-ACP methyl ester carboxylesterase